MSAMEQASSLLQNTRRTWLVTGAAGFIGSSLAEALLMAGQTVVGLDNVTTGKRENLALLTKVGGGNWRFIEGDIRDATVCAAACAGVDVILHEAAQVSVPASMDDPVATHDANTTGFMNLLLAARAAKVRRVVYASSCAVYGDSTRLPLSEEQPAQPLSPYAASKLANEVYAGAFCRSYGMSAVGLRYFNVFGPRQDPNGVYAAVIPLWLSAMITGREVTIFGDGSTTRDFCHISNVIQANLRAATSPTSPGAHEVVNVAAGGRTSLNELFESLRGMLVDEFPALKSFKPVYRPFRAGDIRHSQADISKARKLLGYEPCCTVEQGLRNALAWYRNPPLR
jgi:UDP-N-acetylglucosamine 4-epimerase